MKCSKLLLPLLFLAAALTHCHTIAAEVASPARPVMREFMGVNGHTIQFKPELYAQVCRKVRDYHSFEWDMGKDTDFTPRFPEARNRVNWNDVYGSWKKAGFETDVCVMFNNTPHDSWKDMPKDAHAYGKAFAKAFGPSSPKQLVSSVEIGNEPGSYSDEKYRTVFESMARGLREGDPKLKVATCNITAGQSGAYEKSVTCIKGLDAIYDVISTHSYAMADAWPTWRRSYPEDPKIEFLKAIEALIAWRNKNAQGKPIWLTEFGWDASTKPASKSGDFAKWEGNVSDERQAQYLVRSMLVLSAMDVERAYLYFFNDSDEPGFHASSGITRNFVPKPSFHALAHLYKLLGDYRFARAVQRKPGEVYAYEFTSAGEPTKTIMVAWSPTGSGRTAEIELPLAGSRIVRIEQMPLVAGEAIALEGKEQGGSLKLKIGESPVYICLEK